MKHQFIIITGLAFASIMVGCEERKMEFTLTKRTPQQATIVALNSKNADERYHALVDLEKSKALKANWAVKAMTVLVRSDPSSSVRALAVHNLARVDDIRSWPVLVEAMTDDADRVRFEAAWGLSESHLVFNEETRGILADAEKTLIRAVSSDTSVDVRLNSAKALGQFKTRNVLTCLITALKDPDYAVRYEAEHSLIRLTGRTFGGENKKWLNWLNETKDPFVDAGKTPPELIPTKHNIFEKTRDSLHRFYNEWQGPAKQ
jgi:hypothetical protein